jgi:N-succinyldiaminopimelate aminotransferase
MGMDDWKEIFQLADRHGFVIASDECYSEIYFEEGKLPLGALSAARQLGRGHENLVVFNSLSKRSNVPGLRSGFAAGDKEIIRKFLLYRTYHGSAMSPAVQAASIAAWKDENHVVENRRRYRETFAKVTPILAQAYPVAMPEAAFYYWLKIPGSDTEFARELYRQQHVIVLPGSFLAREAKGINPGAGYVRIALVAGQAECEAAARRMAAFADNQAACLATQASDQH